MNELLVVSSPTGMQIRSLNMLGQTHIKQMSTAGSNVSHLVDRATNDVEQIVNDCQVEVA